MTIRRTIVVGIACLVASCSDRDVVYLPSLVQVVASPEAFRGEPIQVTGYYEGAPPMGPLLFLTEEHALIADTPSSILLWRTVDGKNFSSIDQCKHSYLSIRGRFEELEFGGLGLTDIDYAVKIDRENFGSSICYNALDHDE